MEVHGFDFSNTTEIMEEIASLTPSYRVFPIVDLRIRDCSGLALMKMIWELQFYTQRNSIQ